MSDTTQMGMGFSFSVLLLEINGRKGHSKVSREAFVPLRFVNKAAL